MANLTCNSESEGVTTARTVIDEGIKENTCSGTQVMTNHSTTNIPHMHDIKCNELQNAVKVAAALALQQNTTYQEEMEQRGRSAMGVACSREMDRIVVHIE